MRRLSAFAVIIGLAYPAYAAAQGVPFDPEVATQAYLATLKGAARAKSDAYFEGGYWLILWGALVTILGELIMLRTGLSARFRTWAERVTTKPFLQSMLYAIPYVIVGFIIVLPWTIYTGFVRENQYGLMNQGFGAWAVEQGIDLTLSVFILGLIIAAVMAGIRRAPKNWWIVGTGISGLFIALAMLIMPVFIAPLFNTYTELRQGPVRDRIVAMAQSQGVPADHIYVFDQSKQHKRISANVSGLGPTIRISLNDNLLNRASAPETASVMGHELGHYVLGHVVYLILAFSILFGFSFFIASRAVPAIVARWGAGWGLRGIDDVAAFPVYVIVITAILLVVSPIQKSIIRHNESKADAFGLEVAREPDGFAKIAMKLAEYRKIEPSQWEEILFYDHPSGATRVRMAMEWKAKHLAQSAK
jgi:STE24 endopeptidase